MIEFHSLLACWAVKMPGEQGRTKTLGIKWQPEAIPSLRFVDELGAWHRNDGMLVLGTGVTFPDIMETGTALPAPALAPAAPIVGSPKIRNGGTIGGDVGTASPAGDTLPVLPALDAVVNL